MSGHNKWSKIKNKKGEADAKRGAIFNKLSREIFVAAKAGGGDPSMNASLRMVLDKARAANMPKDNINRAIKRQLMLAIQQTMMKSLMKAMDLVE